MYASTFIVEEPGDFAYKYILVPAIGSSRFSLGLSVLTVWTTKNHAFLRIAIF